MITGVEFKWTSLRIIKKEKGVIRIKRTYLALRIHRLARHGAKLCSTASHWVWGWRRSDRGPDRRLLFGNASFEAAGISHSQMWTAGQRKRGDINHRFFLTLTYKLYENISICYSFLKRLLEISGCLFEVFIFTSLPLRDTDGRKSFSILSIARTISSNTFLWRSSFTTLTCYRNTQSKVFITTTSYTLLTLKAGQCMGQVRVSCWIT